MSQWDCENPDCDHDHEHEEDITVTLTLDNNEELECLVVAIFPMGEQDYIALMPMEDDIEDADEDEEPDIFFYRFTLLDEEGAEPILNEITDEKEYNEVIEAYYEFEEAYIEDEDEDEDEA